MQERCDKYDVDAKRQAITNTCASACPSLLDPFFLLLSPCPRYSSSFFALASYSPSSNPPCLTSRHFPHRHLTRRAFLATLLAAILTAIKLIDILLIDIVLLTSYCTTSRRCSCHSESCANHVTKLAIILAASYSLSSSPRPSRYRPRRVLLAIVLAASYSLSSSPRAPSLTSYLSLYCTASRCLCHS